MGTNDTDRADIDQAGIDQADRFQAERPRLVGLATRILGDRSAAEDVVQQAWLRLHGTDAPIDNLPGWLTTVTSRLCLDRLRTRTHESVAAHEDLADLAHTAPDSTSWRPSASGAADPAEEIVLADTVGIALHVVLDRLTPGERVAFVLHDSFGFDFPVIAAMLETTPAAARKLASRARAKLRTDPSQDAPADADVVDAFLTAAREGDFTRLLALLAPDAVVTADAAAAAMGTPTRIEGAADVAEFFNGAAKAAFPVFVHERPGAAWIHRGEVKVAFDFTVEDGRVRELRFRADPAVLAAVRRRTSTTGS